MLDTLIRHSKRDGGNTGSGAVGGSFATNNNERQAPTGIRRPTTSGAPTTERKRASKMTGVVGKTHTRTLTLKQLKDLINDIYQQKIKYD